MEEFIKLISNEQSKRSEIFMFTWRILMAILMTNQNMNDLCYYFVSTDIKMNIIIDFILSSAFVFAILHYLLWIFLFFWGLRVLTFIEFLILASNNVVLSEEYLYHFLGRFGLFKKDSEGSWYITNRKAYDVIQALCNEISLGSKSQLKSKIYTVTNVLCSTAVWYNTIYKTVNVPTFINYVLITASIIMIIQVFGMEWFYWTSGRLEDIMLKLKMKGFYNESPKN